MDNQSVSLDDLNSIPHVKRMVEDELTARDRHGAEGDEPTVTFSVRLPVTDMAVLENLASYLGHKKTPFASRLLRLALDDALYAAARYEADQDRLMGFNEHMGQTVEIDEDGLKGPVQSRFGFVGEGEVR